MIKPLTKASVSISFYGNDKAYSSCLRFTGSYGLPKGLHYGDCSTRKPTRLTLSLEAYGLHSSGLTREHGLTRYKAYDMLTGLHGGWSVSLQGLRLTR